jgi:ABC-type branched-subunit amino acid transport system permease subunit
VKTPLLVSRILNGLATGMLYALTGIGLSIITGVLNIPNFAHGALFALGAVAAAPGAASVRVWPIMSRGRGARGGRPVPEGVHVDYPLLTLSFAFSSATLLSWAPR